ncbi:hypothetical protein A3C89_03835 [Candidatus Kaiserbacteria bacterium RIFCSPHIGHO2_02_FULL_50_50]|uniref:DUF4401 domain-containing protein n=1 Tax=Candidatus Kaiserbacteria bacterium RIFCSPHIGHO2_02_FULL_50_50 TaxID=1798492 RepID=A0A1F6DGB5_9BACT|nr:MAG: hypothetical protein A3C89_03835 [Candidatus Kaiserbacteria bacterium RIFCSPHIGHO2_02_FULL_50_50]OGG88810.1 MAG: hypothetical protein A3G62_03895 [Candidatus Kaiserbacteria bacterium RIFCSPLOWO2_12_FULL_50_10]
METIALACSPEQLTALQRAAGYVSLTGTVKLLGALALLVGIVYVFWGAIEMLLEWTGFIEVAIWVSAVGLVVLSYFIEEWQIFALLPGSALIAGAAMYTARLRKITVNPRTARALLALIWGVIALFFGSPAVGFLSVGALMVSMGFMIAKTPLCTAIGFENDSVIAPATAQSVFLLLGYTALKVAGLAGVLFVFEPGIFWLASLVSMIGVLILASKWYETAGNVSLLMNLCAAALYFGAILAGNYFDIGALAVMGTVFLILYASEKILEIPASSAIGVGAKIIMLGGFLMFAWNIMQTNPTLQRIMAG